MRMIDIDKQFMEWACNRSMDRWHNKEWYSEAVH